MNTAARANRRMIGTKTRTATLSSIMAAALGGVIGPNARIGNHEPEVSVSIRPSGWLEVRTRPCYREAVDVVPPGRRPAMAQQKTILIVDDDFELVEGLRLMLERQGYRVIRA